jgi:uncharacterized membrane protein
MNPLPKYLYAALAAVAAAHSAYYYSQMPDRMAVHFGALGSSDGWSSKGEFFLIAGLMLGLNILVFALLPWVTQGFRVKKLSVPRSEHWLAAGNIDEFYEYFREKMAWFGIANTVFGSVVMQMVFSANQRPGTELDGGLFTAFLVAYFVFVIIWLLTFFRKLQRA